MLHQLRHAGVDEAKIIDAMVRQGKPIPQDLVDEPCIHPGLHMFYRAFMQLNSCRATGMSEGPIPWTAVCAWVTENNVEGRQRTMVFTMVRAMDVAYLQYRADTRPTT